MDRNCVFKWYKHGESHRIMDTCEDELTFGCGLDGAVKKWLESLALCILCLRNEGIWHFPWSWSMKLIIKLCPALMLECLYVYVQSYIPSWTYLSVFSPKQMLFWVGWTRMDVLLLWIRGLEVIHHRYWMPHKTSTTWVAVFKMASVR